MKITRFEDLEVWQEAREICKIVYDITSIEPCKQDFKFRDQIRASAGSIMDNIAEGFDRGGNKEFIQFLSISRGSVAELRSQSYRAFDVKHITETQLEELLTRTDSISRKIYSLIQHLKNSDIKGLKYK
ncbi:MAG TPA: four helix bundle protein [Bacteroidales bacterium]|nr:four helix bundle protein [Bacteroidales bacterium]